MVLDMSIVPPEAQDRVVAGALVSKLMNSLLLYLLDKKGLLQESAPAPQVA